eukprot:5408744-Pyramimonas_sp.AAC.1
MGSSVRQILAARCTAHRQCSRPSSHRPRRHIRSPMGQWGAAFDKYWLRVVQLTASAPGPAVAIKLYGTCVITVLSYLTQYLPLPGTFFRHERG